MSDQKKPRSINLNNARGSAPAPTARPGQRPMYDQAAHTQRPAASGQVRRTPPQPSYEAPQTTRQTAQQTRRPGTYPQQPTPQRNAAPQRSAAPQRAAAPQPRSAQGYASPQSQPQRPRQPQAGTSYTSASASSAAQAAQRRPQQSTAGARRAAQQKKKRKAMNRFLIGVSSTLAVLLVLYIGIQIWGGTIINEGGMGQLSNVIATPPQFRQDMLNVLVLGIDYSTEDAVVRDPIGMTDMIMYVRFDLKANTIKMLQIPRDFFVGKDVSTGGTGKINAVFKHSKDEDNRVGAVAQVIYDTFGLPVDNYVTIDMDSLRTMVDHFGGIEVYVPQTMEYAGSRLEQGWRHLMGAETEFFLRNRKSFATGDIARLDNQRYFYSALFRRVRTADWKEIVKLMPVVQMYINTDISLNECMGLGIRVLKIPSANMMMCRIPTYDGTENYNGAHSVQVGAKEDILALLNEYFFTPEAPLTSAGLNIADWPHAGVAHASNVQWMADIDSQGGGSVGEAAGDTQTGDNLLAPSSVATSPAA